MSAVIVFPKWLERAGAGDIVRHFQTRGFEIGNAPGSRFMHIERKAESPRERTYVPRPHNFWWPR